MRAGRLRHRAAIYEPSTTRDALNQRTGDPTLVAEVWGRFRDPEPTEVEAAAQKGARVSHVFETRYLAGLGPTMTLVFDDRTFDIGGVVNVEERNREIHLHVTERPT